MRDKCEMRRGLVSTRSAQFPDFEPVDWAEAGLRYSLGYTASEPPSSAVTQPMRLSGGNIQSEMNRVHAPCVDQGHERRRTVPFRLVYPRPDHLIGTGPKGMLTVGFASHRTYAGSLCKLTFVKFKRPLRHEAAGILSSKASDERFFDEGGQRFTGDLAPKLPGVPL